MAYYRGFDGLIYYSTTAEPVDPSTEVACIEEWDLSPRMSPLETTTVADDSQSFRPGRRTASGSLRALLYKPEEGEPNRETAIAFLRYLVEVDGQSSATTPAYLKLGLVAEDGSDSSIDVRVWLTEVRLSKQAPDLIVLTSQFAVQGGAALEQEGESFIKLAGF